MQITEGYTRFGRKLLFLGSGNLKYRDADRIIHKVSSHSKMYLYYKGCYEVVYKNNSRCLILIFRKDITDAIRFLVSEKQLNRTTTIEIDEIYIYHPCTEQEIQLSIV